MNCLVTGANGYIGSKVVSKLLDMGNNVIAIDVNDDHIDKRANIVVTNIFENKDINFNNVDVCLHLAWRDGFVHNSLNHILDLSSHFDFLSRVIESGVRHIAVMGTMHEAGYFEGKMTELKETNPTSLYGISKDCLRRSLSVFCQQKNVKFQWLRAFYIFGNNEFGNSIFSKLVRASKQGEKAFPFTSGKNKYDFISIDDLTTQISMAILQDKILGEINICSGVPISLADKVENFIKENDLDIVLKYGAYPDRTYDSPCVYGDNTKIKKIMEIHENDRCKCNHN